MREQQKDYLAVKANTAVHAITTSWRRQKQLSTPSLQVGEWQTQASTPSPQVGDGKNSCPRRHHKVIKADTSMFNI